MVRKPKVEAEEEYRPGQAGGKQPSAKKPKQNESADGDAGRKRVNKACDRCRLKKCKCDGTVPCDRCRLDNHICNYGMTRQHDKGTYRRSYVQDMESNIRLLTEALQKLFLLAGIKDVAPEADGHFSVHRILISLDILKQGQYFNFEHEPGPSRGEVSPELPARPTWEHPPPNGVNHRPQMGPYGHPLPQGSLGWFELSPGVWFAPPQRILPPPEANPSAIMNTPPVSIDGTPSSSDSRRPSDESMQQMLQATREAQYATFGPPPTNEYGMMQFPPNFLPPDPSFNMGTLPETAPLQVPHGFHESFPISEGQIGNFMVPPLNPSTVNSPSIPAFTVPPNLCEPNPLMAVRQVQEQMWMQEQSTAQQHFSHQAMDEQAEPGAYDHSFSSPL